MTVKNYTLPRGYVSKMCRVFFSRLYHLCFLPLGTGRDIVMIMSSVCKHFLVNKISRLFFIGPNPKWFNRLIKKLAGCWIIPEKLNDHISSLFLQIWSVITQVPWDVTFNEKFKTSPCIVKGQVEISTLIINKKETILLQ